MIKDYVIMAMKGLTRRKMRSWLTLLGIFIGIAAVVSLISLGAGLKLAVANQFNILGAERIIITAKSAIRGPPGSNVASPLTEDDLNVVKKVKGVKVAAGRITQTAVVEINKKTYVTYIGSLPKTAVERAWVKEIANNNIEFGRDLKPSDKHKIVIGNDFHEKDTFGKKLNLGDTITIKGVDFEVVGINEKKGAFTVDSVIAMNEEVVRELFNNPNQYSLIGVKAANLDEVDSLVTRIEKALRKHRGLKEGKEDFEVQTNMQAMESINQTLDIVTILLSGIAAISLVVGGIGIMNTMYTSVLERKPDIGIMKAIGAKNKDIFILFFIESGVLGLVGGIVGVLLGVGLGKLVEFIGIVVLGSSLLQASFSFYLIAGALTFSFVVGAAAGTLPAMRASKLNPVDALRD